MSLIKDNTNSGAFRITIKSPNDGSKAASFHFMERFLSEIAQKRALFESLESNIEHWTQSSRTMDAFARRVLNSSQFNRPVATFIYKIMELYVGIDGTEIQK